MPELPPQNWNVFRAPIEVLPIAPVPNEEWRFADKSIYPGATARVYYGDGHTRLERPVILSDGFNTGPTSFDELYFELNGREYAFADELRERGYDLILLGYDERSASILHNAHRAQQCIRRAVQEVDENTSLVVGGFSMGGIITRYTLAKMETEGIEHQTALYLSFDSPHRGAWIPIGLQAFAHLDPNGALSKQVNSPAARELLWRHIETYDGTPAEDGKRTDLLRALEAVGEWPVRPRKIAVANGNGAGHDNGIPSGTHKALEITEGLLAGSAIYTQAAGDALVAEFFFGGQQLGAIRTQDLPEVDRAAGGKLASFQIAADGINKEAGEDIAIAHYPDVCFVPTVSAVSIREIDGADAGVSRLPAQDSDLDEFLCSSEEHSTMHSEMTRELGSWLIEQISSVK
ncbi:esterase/lipase family protein [Embleya sp. AB8]|uniref:esterase/lipase family protein n=1 Tax=Embleya sp. AB8 TaxID=3156304 RepID=UPI003C758832